MLAFIVRRLASTVLVMGIVAVFVFLLLHLSPGDPAAIIAGDNATRRADRRHPQAARPRRPLPVQFCAGSSRCCRATSASRSSRNEPVAKLIGQRIEPTLSLALTTLIVAVDARGLVRRARRLEGRHAGSTACDGALGARLLGAGVRGRLPADLPVLDQAALAAGAGLHADRRGLRPWIEHLILPSIALGLAYVALIARITRTTMLDVLAEDYIRTARAKGVATRSVLLKHALKNAGVPIVTVIGIGVALLIGGVVITETVFNIPGVGRLVVDAISQARLPDHPGRDPDLLRRLRAGEPARRPELHRCSTRGSVIERRSPPSPHCVRRASRAARSCGASCGAIRPSWSGGAILGGHRCCSRSLAPLIAGDRHHDEAGAAAAPALARRTGSAPTISAATCTPAPSMARASRWSSASSVAAMSISIGLVIGLLAGYLPAGRRRRDAADGRADGDPGDPARHRAGRAHARQRAASSSSRSPSPRCRASCAWCARSCSACASSPTSRPRSPAARDAGKILLRHILPNTIAPLIVQATYICASAILIEAGAVLPRRRHAAGDPDLGQHDRLRAALFLARAPWTIFCPGIALALVVLAVNLLGDGLRDRLDPRLARRM